jgi:pimeloyl-ACP methyl ester carboxylesterase
MRPEPFHINIPGGELDELRQRLLMTRFAPDAGASDGRYGLTGAYLRRLVSHWVDGYDWRAQEREMNRLPHARIRIDGIPLHFVHVQGRGPAPIPLVLSHGFPWSFWDFHRVIGALTDPAAHGGDPADAFDVVVPSLPGFALSSPLTREGVSYLDTADLWVRLMQEVLQYDRFAAYGGDWGAVVTAQLGHKYADHLYGVHLSSLVVPGAWNVDRPWADLMRRAVENAAPADRARVVALERRRSGHIAPQVVHPQTLAHAMHDSPAGLLAWFTERRMRWSDPAQRFDEIFPADFLISSTMLYWLTGTYHTAARFYYEAAARRWQPSHDGMPVVAAPTGLSVFADDVPPGATFEWLGRAFNLVHAAHHPVGGHFGPMERPDELVDDIRTTFRQLR